MHEDRADLIEELLEATRRLCAPQPGEPRDGYHSTDTETSDRELTNDILHLTRNIRQRRSRRAHREVAFVARGQRIEELERQLQDSQLDLREFQTREVEVGRAQAAQLREVQIHADRTELSLVAQLVGVRNELALANQVLAQQHEAHNDLQVRFVNSRRLVVAQRQRLSALRSVTTASASSLAREVRRLNRIRGAPVFVARQV